MPYYPVCLDLRDRACLVIGGGRVAERKVRGLCDCQARVTVLSPDLTPGLRQLADSGTITVIDRPYRPGDLNGFFLVIAATDDPAAQEEIHGEATEKNILLNVADVPDRCNFILPATVRRDEFCIAVSTGGSSPALARRIRQELEGRYGPEYGIYTAMLGILRKVILAAGHDHQENRRQFQALLHDRMTDWIRDRQWDTIKNHLCTSCRIPIPDSCLEQIERLVRRPDTEPRTE